MGNLRRGPAAHRLVLGGRESQLDRRRGHQTALPVGQHHPQGTDRFNIKGNAYRVVVAIRFEFRAVYIRFIGTHAQYDKIDAAEV